MISNDPLEMLAHEISNETGIDMSKSFEVAEVLSQKIRKIMFDNETLTDEKESQQQKIDDLEKGFTAMFCNMRYDKPINIQPFKTPHKTHKITFKVSKLKGPQK